jgi:hypothetical protein
MPVSLECPADGIQWLTGTGYPGDTPRRYRLTLTALGDRCVIWTGFWLW